MIIDLPVTPIGSWFQFSTELDKVSFGFELRWNERESCWYCSLLDGDGNVLIAGRKVVLGGLFRKYRGREGTPQLGDVYAIDTSGAGVDATLTDLGKRVVLTYMSDSEIGL